MNRPDLARHLLFHLARAQRAGRRLSLLELVRIVKVRRSDVRATLTVLDHQGFYDAMRGSLTLAGFVLGNAQREEALPDLRPWLKLAGIKAA